MSVRDCIRTLLALLKLALDMVGLLFLLLALCRGILLRALLGHGLRVLDMTSMIRLVSYFETMERAYVRLVPLPEGGSIDLDDSALDKGVRPDELVVARIVHLYHPTLSAFPSPSPT